jgi:hypothetical protein
MVCDSSDSERATKAASALAILTPMLFLILFLISSPALAQDKIWSWEGEATSDAFGSVSNAGDTDRDGYADVLVSAPNHGSGRGKVYLYSGRTGIQLYAWDGENPGDAFGSSVAAAGDVNHDGFPDLVIGAPYYADSSGPQLGKVYVYSGKDYSPLQLWVGSYSPSLLGYSVSGAGDLNQDGFDDVIAGAPYGGVPSGPNYQGAAFVYSGKDGTILYQFYGEQNFDLLGYSVSGAKDLNGDGIMDVVVSAPYYGNYYGSVGIDGVGKVYAISGLDGSPLWSQMGETWYDHLGFGLSAVGDVDGDGGGDVLIGASDHDGPDGIGGTFINSGKVYLYSGKTGGFLHSWDGEGANDALGYQVHGAGDVNGDGHEDLIVGSPNHNGDAGTQSGKVYLYSGANYRELWSWEGEQSGSHFFAVSGGGDVDGDGLADLIIGAPGFDGVNGADSGKAYVFVGNDLFLYAAPDPVVAGKTLTLSARTEIPGKLMFLVIVAVNGNPVFDPIGPFTFDPNGEVILSSSTDLSWKGVTFNVIAISQNSVNKFKILSNDELVVIQ